MDRTTKREDLPLPWHRIQSAKVSDPVRVLFSACLLGHPTGWEGDSYDEASVLKLSRLGCVAASSFCPENAVLGTPRLLTTLYGGDGRAALRGQAKVRQSDGVDVTQLLLNGAEQMLALAVHCRAELAVLLEISDSCGSHALYLGEPRRHQYQQGVGIAAARLIEHGIPVIGSRDARTLEALLAALDPEHVRNPEARDYVEEDWYRDYFRDGPVGVALGEG